MAAPAAACAICKGTILPGALEYRSCKESTGVRGPTELYRHLSSVAGAVPSLCSAFLRLPCRGSVPMASRQKEPFEQSRKKILRKLHRDEGSAISSVSSVVWYIFWTRSDWSGKNGGLFFGPTISARGLVLC